MFSLFKKSSEAPVDEDRRVWIDDCFIWLRNAFVESFIKEKRVLTPTKEDFPIGFIASEENAFELLDIVAPQMDLDPELIDIDFYVEGQAEIVTGAGLYSRAFLRRAE